MAHSAYQRHITLKTTTKCQAKAD